MNETIKVHSKAEGQGYPYKDWESFDQRLNEALKQVSAQWACPLVISQRKTLIQITCESILYCNDSSPLNSKRDVASSTMYKD